jgi:hypothetical protein
MFKVGDKVRQTEHNTYPLLKDKVGVVVAVDRIVPFPIEVSYDGLIGCYPYEDFELELVK